MFIKFPKDSIHLVNVMCSNKVHFLAFRDKVFIIQQPPKPLQCSMLCPPFTFGTISTCQISNLNWIQLTDLKRILNFSEDMHLVFFKPILSINIKQWELIICRNIGQWTVLMIESTKKMHNHKNHSKVP